MSQKPTIIHIGYPKTGTKWLQKNYFPNTEGCFFLARPHVFSLIIKPDIFEFSATHCRQEIERMAQGKRVVLSEELLLGGLDIGFGVGEFMLLMVGRLKSVFRDAQIVITLRNQVDIASSVYGHYIKSGGTYSPKKFFGLSGRHRLFFKNHHLFSLKLFDYDRVVNLYREYFGPENILILFYEDFKANPESYINNLSAQTGLTPTSQMPHLLPENVRLSSFSAGAMRCLNRFTAKNTVFKNHLLDIPTLYYRTLSITERLDGCKCLSNNPFRLPQRVEKAIASYYMTSNARLAGIVGLERLKELGYPLLSTQ